MKPVHQLLDGALAALIATGAPLDPTKVFVGVGLSVNDKGPDTMLSDVNPATGAMATLQPVASWSAVYHLDDGSPVVDAPTLRFVPASAAESQTLAVWYLSSALTAGNLLAFGYIEPPAIMVDQHSEWAIVLRVVLDQGGQWSAEVQFNG